MLGMAEFLRLRKLSKPVSNHLTSYFRFKTREEISGTISDLSRKLHAKPWHELYRFLTRREFRPARAIWPQLKVCYGAFTTLASMLDPIEFLRLQALDCFLYKTAISRVQTRCELAEPPLSVLVDYTMKFGRLCTILPQTLYRRDFTSNVGWTRFELCAR